MSNVNPFDPSESDNECKGKRNVSNSTQKDVPTNLNNYFETKSGFK